MASDTCAASLVASVKGGVNVLIWSFVQMMASASSPPAPEFGTIPGFPVNAECVKQVQQQTKELEATIGKTVHLVSVGGWGAPHPVLQFSASEWSKEWTDWNQRNGFDFDGLDWDVEGTNDVTSVDNTIPVPLLELMGELSIDLKKDGYLVSMAPPESYLDPTRGSLPGGDQGFDTSLLHDYPEWATASPPQPFAYHGLNSYAYLFARYPDLQFDLVMQQIYETYSHASFAITKKSPPIPAADYLTDLVHLFSRGWIVDFTKCKTCTNKGGENLGKVKISVPPSRFVIGLANGWADGAKSLFVDPIDVGKSYTSFVTNPPRGYMFWDIGHEGIPRDGSPVVLAAELNKFMHIRK
jgi:hypothetical protein